MKTISKKDEAHKQERNVWICVKLNYQENCKSTLEELIKKKRQFHNVREFVFENSQAILKASPSIDTRQWRENINTFQEKSKALAAEIHACEAKLKKQLWIADFALNSILEEEKHNKTPSPSTTAMLTDLRALKEEVNDLKMNKAISFSYTHFQYPTSNKKEETDCSKENERIFNSIQKKMVKEKKRDERINQTIENHYKKIAGTSQKIVEHNKYTYKQSWYTGIVNVVVLLTGIGIIDGLYSKATGGHFFIWEKTSTVDVHPKTWNRFRQSADILGVSNKR